MKRLTAVLCFALFAALTGCDSLNGSDDDDAPFEHVFFYYAYADETGGDGSPAYTVTAPDGTPCPGIPTDLPLAVLAEEIQRPRAVGGFYDAIVSVGCIGTFSVRGDAVQDVRDNGQFFDYRVAGAQNDALIRANRLSVPSSTDVDPTGIFVQTSGGLSVGTATTQGEAEVFYVSPGRTWRCAGGGPVWSENASGANATFFEMELTAQSDERVRGEFKCIARNASDASDARLLLILEGSFSMVPR